jgi:pimeloyl-ACP methyl ester carboxylesterase
MRVQHPWTSKENAMRMPPLIAACLLFWGAGVHAQVAEKVVDLPTRPGVTQRLLFTEVPGAKAAVVLLAGGHGGLQLQDDGSMRWGEGNFLVRSRALFARQGVAVVVVDAPSDKQRPPHLSGHRQRPEHVADMQAVIAWLRETVQVPVWLVGTSRGTQSVAYVATTLDPAKGPDGVVLTATILTDPQGRPVTAMALERLRVPVLVVHHEQDGCSHCPYREVPTLMRKLGNAPRSEAIGMTGGITRGDPCEAASHHGFNGIEAEVVQKTVAWMLAK